MMASKIITALDYPKATDALTFTETLDPKLTRVKVGKELFTRAGPQVVKDLSNQGFDVFLDLKFHDIPNTVAAAVSAACELGVWMVNVHASGGQRMMEAAASAVHASGSKTLLIGVTILTSMTDEEVSLVGFMKTASEQAVDLAMLAASSGLDGVVCSPHEVPSIRQSTQPITSHFLTVTPGVRPAVKASGSLQVSDDQRRTMTPSEAIQNGSDYLVIGRPITQADNPNDALTSILHETQRADKRS